MRNAIALLLYVAMLSGGALALTGCPAVILTGATATATTAAEERSFGTAIDDHTIALQIRTRFIQHNDNELITGVSVQVIEGRVLLTGSVQKPDNVIAAINIAWQVNGVKEVINEIKVRDRTGVKDYARDAWITGQVKTRLLLAKDIRSINYSIETVNGDVYLMGIAQSALERDQVEQIARTTQYVHQVISYVRLKDDPRRGQPQPR